MIRQFLKFIFACVLLTIGVICYVLVQPISLTPFVQQIDTTPVSFKMSTFQASRSENLTDLSNFYFTNQNRNTSMNETRHIGFLKVHKCASSTMQNIFIRFGLKRNLTFVLSEWTNKFLHKPTMPVKPGGHYDILAIHSIYNKQEFDAILPEDKVNIGIVREPLERMISAAYYYRDVWKDSYLRKLPKENFIRELINQQASAERMRFSRTSNTMGKDFGFKSELKETDRDAIKERLNFLDQEFKLVLVMERFEESLVLMKRYLGWQMVDILFLQANTHAHPDANLTVALKTMHRHTCFLDYAIYDFFSKSLDMKVQAEGPYFKEEVRQFENILQKTKVFCSQQNAAHKLQIAASQWNALFAVSYADCEFMKLEEKFLLSQMKERHKQMNEL